MMRPLLQRHSWVLGFSLAFGLLLQGCVTNPVTGQRELGYISSQAEVRIGAEQYAPAQQMQGGAYQTDAQLSAYVNQVGQKLARASGVDLPYEFVVLNSSVPNAWALPGGKIAVNRGLLTALRNESELAAVLGHEVAHAAARHGAKRVERGMLSQGVLLGVAIFSAGSEYAKEVIGGAQQVTTLINQKYSRNAEREADYYGTQFMVKAGYDPYGAVTLQETFVRLSGSQQTDWLQGLFASHPASTERLANNRMLIKRLRSEGATGGVLGQPAYARAMASLVESQDAFDAFDEATVMYGQGDYDGALGRIASAISQKNNEAVFHGLRGAIRYKQARFADAVTNFDRAIARDNDYFFFYLNRGLAFSQNNEAARAKADLMHSIRLLPTAPAYQGLGELAEAEGDVARAKEFYAQAGQGGGAEAQAARNSLVRLDLPTQPAKYLQASVVRTEQNQLVMRLRNRTNTAVRNVVVSVEYTTATGVRTVRLSVPKLAANGVVNQRLELDPTTIERIQAYAVAASIGG